MHKLFLKYKINLLDQDYKKEQIINLFSAKFNRTPIIMAEKLGVQLSDESKNNLIEQAIHRVLRKNNITNADLEAWFEVNKAQIDKVFIEYIENRHADRRKTLISISAALIYSNIDSNIKNKYGDTALIEAAWRNQKEIVEMLLNANANPDIQGSGDGLTALILATMGGYKEIVEMLLNANAAPNIKSKNGLAARNYTEKESFQVIANLLKRYGAK